MRVYNIRAHHGMCLYFFRGKGYSGEFVENMSAMKAILEENPSIRLMDSADDICAACPNKLRQHRIMGQGDSARDIGTSESMKNAGILDVFPIFHTARLGQNIRRSPLSPLCGVALTETCAEKASRYDREVLRRCGLSVGDTLPYLEFSRNVIETILRPGLRGSICGDCQWSSLCQWKENP